MGPLPTVGGTGGKIKVIPVEGPGISYFNHYACQMRRRRLLTIRNFKSCRKKRTRRWRVAGAKYIYCSNNTKSSQMHVLPYTSLLPVSSCIIGQVHYFLSTVRRYARSRVPMFLQSSVDHGVLTGRGDSNEFQWFGLSSL